MLLSLKGIDIMAEAIFKQYLANLQATLNQGDARE
jgi:hypothetical protein